MVRTFVDEKTTKGDSKVACKAGAMFQCDLVEAFRCAPEDIGVGGLSWVCLRESKEDDICGEMHVVWVWECEWDC